MKVACQLVILVAISATTSPALAETGAVEI
jgi:hypothetical protein